MSTNRFGVASVIITAITIIPSLAFAQTATSTDYKAQLIAVLTQLVQTLESEIQQILAQQALITTQQQTVTEQQTQVATQQARVTSQQSQVTQQQSQVNQQQTQVLGSTQQTPVEVPTPPPPCDQKITITSLSTSTIPYSHTLYEGATGYIGAFQVDAGFSLACPIPGSTQVAFAVTGTTTLPSGISSLPIGYGGTNGQIGKLEGLLADASISSGDTSDITVPPANALSDAGQWGTSGNGIDGTPNEPPLQLNLTITVGDTSTTIPLGGWQPLAFNSANYPQLGQ